MKRVWLLAILAAVCLAMVWLFGSRPALADEPPAATTEKAAAESTKTDKESPTDEAKKDEAKKDEPKFIRVRRNAKEKPLAMETAVVRYISADRPGVTVDLVGAIHIGDKTYYDELNKLFEGYEVVLYELVAPEGTRVPKEGRERGNAHPVAALQNGMGAMLELEHQLDRVDYTKENFVHADMSP
jgi:hypothetical protein